MSFHNFLSTPVFLAALIAAPVFGQSTPITYIRDYVFLPVSLAEGETVQVNVANTAKAPAVGTAEPCKGTISFTYANGTTASGPTQFSVAPGLIDSTSFSNSSGSRDGILAAVQQTLPVSVLPGGTIGQPASTTTVPCSLVMSLEIFSATTHVVLGNATVIPTPIPLPVSASPLHEQ